MRAKTTNRFALSAIALVALTSAACEQGTDPVLDAPLDEAVIAQFAEAVAESSDSPMPSMGALLRASRAAIDAQGGNDEAVAHFRRARRLANAAEDSLEAGNTEAARALSGRSYRNQLSGIVIALGDEAVVAAVVGSTAGLERMQSRIEGRDVPERVTKALQRVAAQLTAANEQLAAGKPVPALHHALTAAEGIRHLSPRYVARKWIGRAAETLRSALQAVGDAPTEEEATAIRRARRLLNVAKDEFEAGAMKRALDAAQRSARLSWGVVQGRSG